MYGKDPYEAKLQFLIKKREITGLKHFNDSKAFISYSHYMDGIDKNITEFNPNKKRKVLIVFDDLIADLLTNKNCNPIVTELFIRGRKVNISLIYITQYYFAVPKNVRLNSMHYLVMKNQIKREIQEIALNHSSDIDFKDFMNLYKSCTAKPYSFLVIDVTLASDNPFLQKEYKN